MNPKFEKVPKIKRVLEDMIDVPIIIELNDGTVVGGNIDDYVEPRRIALYNCRQLADDLSGWTEFTERFIHMKDSLRPDFMPYFALPEIKKIWCAKDPDLYLDDVLKLWLNPHYKPVKGIECGYSDTGRHSRQCNRKLHEALTSLGTMANSNIKEGEFKKQREISTAMVKIREYLIKQGAKIP